MVLISAGAATVIFLYIANMYGHNADTCAKAFLLLRAQ